MSSILKRIIETVLILLAASAAGMLLLFAVYHIPTDRIRTNIAAGAGVILQEGEQHEYIEGYKTAILDNSTDSLMLEAAIFPTADPLQDSIMVPYCSYDDLAPDASLLANLNQNEEAPKRILVYPRYWHGYLSVLKPFFSLFDYSEFRIINQMLQLSIIFFLLLTLKNRRMDVYIPSFIMLVLFWNPATMGVSLQYSSCFYLSTLAMFAIIILYPKGTAPLAAKTEHRLDLVFLTAGILTAYFDFLTYPATVCGVPLTAYLLTKAGRGRIKLTEFLAKPVYWCIGYLGMWGEKWIFGSLLAGQNIIQDALGTITQRTSSVSHEAGISRLGTVWFLLRTGLLRTPYLIMFILGMMIILIVQIRHVRQSDTDSSAAGHSCNISSVSPAPGKYSAVPYLLLTGLIPFAWYFLAANHSYEHPRLVCRLMGVSIFAWSSMFSMLVNMLVSGLKERRNIRE